MKCKHFNTCSAPLCPMDNQTLDGGLWYPHEEICKLRKFAKQGWIRKQRKIVKIGSDTSRYFTVDMLNSIKSVKKGIKGLDPDQEIGLKQGFKVPKRLSSKS